ncbi:hypothetical protein ACA910_013952 [Epithemia clementina (nom. ined.)]
MSGRSRRGNNDPQGGGDGGGDPAAAAAAPAVKDALDYPQLILAALQATNNVLASLGVALQNLPADMGHPRSASTAATATCCRSRSSSTSAHSSPLPVLRRRHQHHRLPFQGREEVL